MKYRQLGRTGLSVSELGFGAGMVAGLFVRGSDEDQILVTKRAIELGFNHFDTAPLYGDGSSETKLGIVLEAVDPEHTVIVSTKVEYFEEHFSDFRDWTLQSVESSLGRLHKDAVDVLYLHNNIRYDGVGPHDGYEAITPEQVLKPGGIADALDHVRDMGLARFIGFTGTGDADAVMEVLDSGRFDVVQAFYNLLNPSGSIRLPESSTLHDFGQLINRAANLNIGVVAIRVLGGGVLGGIEARDGSSGTTSSQSIHGISYSREIEQAATLNSILGGGESYLRNLAIRFAIVNPAISSALIGFSSVGQLEVATRALSMEPPTRDELDRLERIWAAGFG